MCLALAIAGCGGGSDNSSSSTGESASSTSESPSAANPSLAAEVGKKAPKIEVPSGPQPKALEENEIVEGTGAEAKAGDEVTVHYVGAGYETKKEFESSFGGEPFSFVLGSGYVIPGWEEGIPGMKVGGRRELVIPGELAYGPEGSPPEIGPNETLIFVIDLVGLK
jgi:peptidylprolyl isomerase